MINYSEHKNATEYLYKKIVFKSVSYIFPFRDTSDF